MSAAAQALNAPEEAVARASAMDTHVAAMPQTRAVRTSESVVLDGRLDEGAWRTAPRTSAFTQTDPGDGAQPSERTEIAIIYDENAIYVGARMFSARGTVSSRLGRRDSELNDSDWLTVVFDSYHDHQGGYRFRINPSGVKGDEANGDRTWDPVWDAAVSVDSAGWTAELRIPFSQLRFGTAATQLWGIQLQREIAASAEKMVSSYTPKSEKGGSARFGHLLGLENIPQSHRLEVLPYVAARAEYKHIPLATDAPFANPFRSGRDYSNSSGADVKYRPTPNLTLDMTINPDFGQIEADESQVNLSANETFVGERRPFFIEGSSIFRTTQEGGGNDLFYTRRIGRAPHAGAPSGSVYADVPEATSILGAAKLTGRTAQGWSLGILEAVTSREDAAYVGSDGSRGAAEVEPWTNYLVGRLRRDFRDGASSAGGIVTQVTRSLEDSLLTQWLHSSATVIGVDVRHDWAQRMWGLTGTLVGSSVQGSPNAITATQRSSLRYFQRPDARSHHVDSLASSLRGFQWSANINKMAGKHWRGHVWFSGTSPGFETNDLAFQTSADRIRLEESIAYEENEPGRVLRRWTVRATPDQSRNFDGDITGNGLKVDGDITFLNYWNTHLTFDRDWVTRDDRLTRGGPLARNPGQTSLAAWVSTNSRLAYTASVNVNARRTPAGGWSNTLGGRLGFKPTSAWSAELEPRWSRSHGVAQYVTTIADEFAVETYGQRYIFAPIEQTTASMNVRLNVTMRPTLTLALVAQPFLASGRYGTPRQLAAPRTYDFTEFGRDVGTMTRDSDGSFMVDPDGAGPAAPFSVWDPSFNRRTLNATAALRWEWLPGSSAYLVWQQRRSAPGTLGDFEFDRDRADLFRAVPENTLLLKVSYWLNP
ncbi:MAG: DUF5916 domain-containing protein [Gemmatimonadaceae bacterium]